MQSNKQMYVYIYIYIYIYIFFFFKGLLRNRYGVSQKENHLLVDEWERVSDPQEGRRRPSYTAKRMKIPAVALQRSNKTSLLWHQGASQVVQLVNNMPANEGDTRDAGSTSGSGRSLGEGNDKPVQYYCVGNSMDRGAWQAAAHVVTKSKTWLSVHAHTHTHPYSIKWMPPRPVHSEASPWGQRNRLWILGEHSTGCFCHYNIHAAYSGR